MTNQITKTGLHLPVWARQAIAFAALDLALLADMRVHWIPKLILLGTLAYWISPVDFIMGIPGVDALDDLAVLGIGHGFFYLLCPEGVAAEHAEKIEKKLAKL